MARKKDFRGFQCPAKWSYCKSIILVIFLLQAKLYLKGDKDFCSIASDGTLQVIGVVRVPPNDARSVAVPIVPKRIGEIELEVSSILQVKFGLSYRNVAGDAVKRKLLVVVCVLKFLNYYVLTRQSFKKR